MNKIILKDKTSLEFNKIEGLNITFADKTVEELEKAFTKDNCSKVQLTTSMGEVYGIYNNLECTSITKNIEDETVTVNLNQLNDLAVKVEILQSTVDELVTNSLNL